MKSRVQKTLSNKERVITYIEKRNDLLFDVKECATATGVSPTTVRKLLAGFVRRRKLECCAGVYKRTLAYSALR